MTKENDAHAKNLAATSEDGVLCEIDGTWVHSISAYLKVAHPDTSVDNYLAIYPDAKLISPRLEAARKAKEESGLVANMTAQVVQLKPKSKPTLKGQAMREATVSKKPFSEVFGLGNAPAAKNKRGDPIMIDVLGGSDPEIEAFIPDVDNRYIFPIDILKALMMGMQMNIPVLKWGMHGTGKTTIVEQFCARTGRAMIRVQHTISTEEAHILGQFTLVNHGDGPITEFNPGPLAYAMRYGLVYLADEYDFALPAVTSVYQPVLEGKSLIIKEACPEWRVVHPHPNFRFVATGNTNGGGDETGLYQGTQMQNAANYSRFGITVEVPYMEKSLEIAVVESQGQVHKDDATALVTVGGLVREAFRRGDIGVTVSPRELIRAAELGRAMGGDWRQALALAYTNRLNTVDREAVVEMINRIIPKV